jgi:hypothetical protein
MEFVEIGEIEDETTSSFHLQIVYQLDYDQEGKRVVSKMDWEGFCLKLNALRKYSDLNSINFIRSETLTADMWNEAIEAFADVADVTGSYFDVERFTVSRGDPVTKELIDEVNADIAAVIELLT